MYSLSVFPVSNVSSVRGELSYETVQSILFLPLQGTTDISRREFPVYLFNVVRRYFEVRSFHTAFYYYKQPALLHLAYGVTILMNYKG